MYKLLFIIMLIPVFCLSQIQINEIFANNENCCLDDFNETEDFIEIINLGDEAIDLAGYYFGDMNSGSQIPDNNPEFTVISPGGLLVLWFDEDPEQGPLHIDAKLSSGGETIFAQNAFGEEVFNISYEPQYEDVSFCSFPDGSDFDVNWLYSICPTPGDINENCPFIQGCLDYNALNYNLEATFDDGSCIYNPISGIMINEYSAANWDGVIGEDGEYDDWIELYNNSSELINLNGYYLSDRLENNTKWQFLTDVTVEPYDYVLIFASKKNYVSNTEIHTNFKITQTKQEYIVLSDSNGNIIDAQFIENPNQKNHSTGRQQDGDSVWSIFTEPTPSTSNSTVPSNVYVSNPVFSLESGNYSESIEINISAQNCDVYYTTDGSTPSNMSTLYTNPVFINETTCLRAIAYSQEDDLSLPSFIETNTYFINESHTVPILSISGDDIETILNGNDQIISEGNFEYFDENINLIDESYGEFNEHGGLSNYYDQRGLDYVVRDQFGYDYQIEHQLFRTKDRDEFERIMFKGAAGDNYPFAYSNNPGSGAHIRDAYVQSLSQIGDLRLDERSYEPCVLYVNGQYWGMYDLREKVDDNDFTEYYYNQPAEAIDVIQSYGGTWADYGSTDAWLELCDFILNNDMTEAENYEYVSDSLNIGSVIDHMAINTFVANGSWLAFNTMWWRGKNPDGDKQKWRYALWDMDFILGHPANEFGFPESFPTNGPCDYSSVNINYGNPNFAGLHFDIFNALYTNNSFKSAYINRYSDLVNTTFSCDVMLNHIDSLETLLLPEMEEHTARWGGSVSGWEGKVEYMRDFIEERCDMFSDSFVDCYDLEGPFDLTVIIDGDGELELNTIDLNIDDSPWNGVYYGGVEISLDVENGNFSYWEIIDGDMTLNDIYTDSLTLNLTDNITIVVHFDYCSPQETELIIGPDIVQEGSIYQYYFTQNTGVIEWDIQGGEVLWTSSVDNSIAIQWDYDIEEGQIVLNQINGENEIECFYLNISITPSIFSFEENDQTVSKYLINIVDILGKKVNDKSKKSVLFYIYNDGSVEKKYFID